MHTQYVIVLQKAKSEYNIVLPTQIKYMTYIIPMTAMFLKFTMIEIYNFLFLCLMINLKFFFTY